MKETVINFIERAIKTNLWGISVALAWTWGIGLFFTVHVAVQFGFQGLLTFATINAFGLTLFGLVNSKIAAKYNSPAEYEQGFLARAHGFKFPFFLYQLLAITLTLFAVLKYLTFPLGALSALVCVMFAGATIFLGEEFKIERIKYSHLVMFIFVATSLIYLLNSIPSIDPASGSLFDKNLSFDPFALFHKDSTPTYLYWIPVAVGFLLGPWLDLQHWQRAIQIRKEGLSIAKSYISGGLIFWSIVMSHGILAIVVSNVAKSIERPIGLFTPVKDVITTYFYNNPELNMALTFYIIFVCLAALATFDSGYVALKWYSKEMIKDSKSVLLSFVPKALVESPVTWFVGAITIAMSTLHFSELGKLIARLDPSLEKFFWFELEYYMAFYAAFFVVYAVALIRLSLDLEKELDFHFLKLFSTGLCSLSIFGIGYFGQNTLIMATAAVIPLIYGLILSEKKAARSEVTTDSASQIASQSTVVGYDDNELSNQVISSKAEMIPNTEALPAGATPTTVAGCYMLDRWFVHSFIPTYQDTNSVGNIYFANYGMWVGKTRELFFLHTMPDFDPATSDFLILTRSYEHKFLKELKEFQPVSVYIRVKDYNRKFVTLEHKVLDEDSNLVGKGIQTLMFVDSRKYNLIDIPQEVYSAYLPYLA